MTVDQAGLRDAIKRVYTEVVNDPKKGYHFHTGPDLCISATLAASAPLAMPSVPSTVVSNVAGQSTQRSPDAVDSPPAHLTL